MKEVRTKSQAATPPVAISLRTHSVIAGSPFRPPSYGSLTIDESPLSLRKRSAFQFVESVLRRSRFV